MEKVFMITNPITETMLNRKSIRRYRDEIPTDEVIKSIVRAGQQAPFVSQLYSVLLSRKKDGIPFGAPLLFTICVDFHKLQLFMARRKWEIVSYDLAMLLYGIQDASLMAENMVIAAESMGLGSCFLGGAPFKAVKIVEEYKLPERVFPLVQLVMGYPAESPPPRPRYPMEFVLFEDEYPEFSQEQIDEAMREMDDGYLAQDYYRRAKYIIPLEDQREESFTFEDYSWTEHISRKWGQWFRSPQDLLEQLSACGFQLNRAGTEHTT
jgi:nitroreductase